MRARGPLLAAIAVALSLSVAHSATAPTPAPSAWKPAQPAKTGKGRLFIDGVLDSGQYLPDTTLMLRVGPRATRAKDFIENYFDSYAEYRPSSDSLGRVEFMNSFIKREVMALVALQVNRPLSFEDRAVLREYSQRALSNALMQRMVLDSVTVTDAEVRQLYDQTSYEQRFRQIVFADQNTATRVRAELVSGKTGWAVAWPKYNRAKGGGDLGDQGFIARDRLDNNVRFMLYTLKPGEYSLPFEDPQGWHVVQVTERRKLPKLEYVTVRPLLEGQVRDLKTAVIATRMQDQLRERFGVVYDAANIAYVASLFPATVESEREGGGLSGIHFRTKLPAIAPEDTGRVLARDKSGMQLSLGTFMTHYRGYAPLLRPAINSPTLLRTEIDVIMLEPYRAQVALEHHLDRDPMVTAPVDRRRERILVEHLYEDSVESKVWLSPEQRRKYYQEHLSQFVTFSQVRFAIFVAANKPAADSLMTRLRGGERPEAILRADSLAGRRRGSIQTQAENQDGLPLHTQVFQDMKPGQVESYGPDDAGQYTVVKSIEMIPGHQLSYEESERYVDESLHNLEAEKLLDAFIARHRKRFPIEAHPELVMKLRWVDPVASSANS